jgi:hypothetical protein
MLSELFVMLIVGSLVLGPLLWRLHQDRRRERALAIRADLHATLFRALEGDSLVGVDVQSPTLWHPGRVVLSAPADWTWLLEPAWGSLAAHVPAGYELVVKPVAPVAPSLAEDLALPRAA